MFMAAGQVNAGASVSFTVTRKEQVRVFPEASVARQITIVIPFWKVAVLPAALVPPLIQTGCPLGKPQLSIPVGVGYVTTVLH